LSCSICKNTGSHCTNACFHKQKKRERPPNEGEGFGLTSSFVAKGILAPKENFVSSYKKAKTNSDKKVIFDNNEYVKYFHISDPSSKIIKSKLHTSVIKRGRSRCRKPKSTSKHQFFPEIINQEIHNISKYKPSNFEKSILSLGLNFIPTPNASSKKHLLKEFDDFANNLRKRKALIHFRNDPIVNQSNISLALHAIKKPQSSKIYDVFPQNSAIEKYINSVKSSLNSAIDQNKFNKVPNKELIRIKKTISKLKNNKDIVIKPTDKNLGLCIMDADFYLKECHRQLDDSSTYKKLDKSPNFKGILTQLKRILYKFNHLYNKDNSLTYLAKTILYPLINNIYKIGKFYIIP